MYEVGRKYNSADGNENAYLKQLRKKESHKTD